MERLFDSELKVMEPLWDDGPQTAGALAKRLAECCGWNRNTTYTVIKKLVDKGAVRRTDPGFPVHRADYPGGRPAPGDGRPDYPAVRRVAGSISIRVPQRGAGPGGGR